MNPMDFANSWLKYRGMTHESGVQEKFSRWERIKNFFAGAVKAGSDLFGPETPTPSKTIAEDVQSILTLDPSVRPSGINVEAVKAARDAMVAALKKRGHSEEAINKYFRERGTE